MCTVLGKFKDNYEIHVYHKMEMKDRRTKNRTETNGEKEKRRKRAVHDKQAGVG